MDAVGLVLDPIFKRHLTGAGHPERPARYDAITRGLEARGLAARLTRVAPTPVALDLVHRVHSPEYVERLRAACRNGQPYIDEGDSAIGPESYEIALLAAGATVEAARCVARGELRRAFCAVRPPGHHCEVGRSMGFCLLNNVALAARVFRDEADLDRVLILDFDVHHGNGTQHIFEEDPTLLYVSLHGHPRHLYPGTGYEWEVGVGPGRGFTLNVPLLPGAGDEEYRSAFERLVIPRVDEFRPQVVLLSAGFDAHEVDPLAEMLVSDDGFDWITRTIVQLADTHAGGRIVSVLEGGYDLGVLERCVAAHVERLCVT